MTAYAARLDEVSATLHYAGKALPGSLTSAAVWQIQRISISGGGTQIDTAWADGNDLFDNIWDNRAALSYS